MLIDDEAIIISACKKGNKEAWEKLVALYKDYVYTYLIKVCKLSYEEADDLFQQVFLSLYLNINKFRQEASLKTYLATIIRNKYNDYIRLKKKGTEIDPLPNNFANSSNDITEKVIKLDKAQMINVAIEKLPPDYKKVIKLRFYNNLSLEEISNKLNISISLTGVRLSRAIAKLREILENQKFFDIE